MSIIKSIDDYLLNKQAERSKRERSGCFSPSMFGRCYRAQFWNRKNEPQTNPPDINSLRKFECGNLFHDFVQNMLPPHLTEVKVAVDPDILGFADIVGDNFVADLKSVHSKKFWYMAKSGYNIDAEEIPKILQVVYYASRLQKPIAKLVFISKDDLCIEERDFIVEKWVDRLDDEIQTLRNFWGADILPAAKPKAYGGKEGKYCPFLDKCMSLGFDCIKAGEKRMNCCWYCQADLETTQEFYGDTRCPKCGILNSIHNPADIQPKEEEEMGKLGEIAKLKSPYVKLEIGQSSEPMVYKSWKEVTNSFGMDSFRYTFEVQTDSGMITKTLDVGSTAFAMKMDEIPFGSKVIVTRNQKLDAAGNEVEDKSVYDVALAE